MAATGYTPIYLYYSSTTSNVPSASSLGYGELAINITDGKLFYKNNANAVVTIPVLQSSGSQNGWLSSTDWTTFNSKAPGVTFTSNYVPYGQGTTTLNQSAALTFNGTSLNSGGGTLQYAPRLGARASGNDIEWGHGNGAGYGNTLGAESSSGAAFLAFYAGAGTNANTYKTLGRVGSVIKPDASGGFGFYSVANSSADNQSLTTVATLSSAGALVLGTPLAVGSGGTGLNTVTAGYIPYGNGTSALSTSSSLYFSGTNLGVGTSTTFAKISSELSGGNAICARYNSSNPRTGIYVAGSAGTSFVGGNLTYSSGNVFNYDRTGLAWTVGDTAGTGVFSIQVSTGTAGNSAATDTTTNNKINIYAGGGVTVGNTTDPGANNLLVTGTVVSASNIYSSASSATNMTNGFVYIPGAAGAPTGTPTAVSGKVPMYYDTTNNKFYIYNGAWKSVALA